MFFFPFNFSNFTETWYRVECFVSVFPGIQCALWVYRVVTYISEKLLWSISLTSFLFVIFCLFFRILQVVQVIAYDKAVFICLSSYYFFLILFFYFVALYSFSISNILVSFHVFSRTWLLTVKCMFPGLCKSSFISYCLTVSSPSSCIFDMSSCFIDMVALFRSFFKFMTICIAQIFICSMDTFFFLKSSLSLPFYLFFSSLIFLS